MDTLAALLESAVFPFAAWPTGAVPLVAAGIYTIWDGAALVYVGMAGRGLTAAALGERSKRTGLHTRLASHASGRRIVDEHVVAGSRETVTRASCARWPKGHDGCPRWTDGRPGSTIRA